jgi:hypothetical protein
MSLKLKNAEIQLTNEICSKNDIYFLKQEISKDKKLFYSLFVNRR